MAEEAAIERWTAHIAEHENNVVPLARQNSERAAEAMVHRSMRSFGRLKPEVLEEGDAVRVSFLVLPSVRAVVKSAIVGEPVPLWSPKLYQVEAVYQHGLTSTYDVSTSEGGENDVLISGRRFAMPSTLSNVDRRILLYSPDAVRHPALGRRYPRFVDAAFARSL